MTIELMEIQKLVSVIAALLAFFWIPSLLATEKYFQTYQGPVGCIMVPNGTYTDYKIYLESTTTKVNGVFISSISLNKSFMGNVSLYSQDETPEGLVKVSDDHMAGFNHNIDGSVMNKIKVRILEQKQFFDNMPFENKKGHRRKNFGKKGNFTVIMTPSEKCPYQVTTSFMDVVASCNLKTFSFQSPTIGIWKE